MKANNGEIREAWIKHWKNQSAVDSVASPIGVWLRRKRLEIVGSIISKLDHEYSVIDLGCGAGTTLDLFRKEGFDNSIGIDFVHQSLDRCKCFGFVKGKDVFFMDAGETNFQDQEFDIVFSEGLWEHFPDPKRYINEAARICKKYIIVIQPDHYTFFGRLMLIGWKLLYSTKGGIKEYSFRLSYFEEELRDFGFKLIETRSSILKEQAILVFERVNTHNKSRDNRLQTNIKRERWKEAQKHELEYIKTGKNKVWSVPHTLDYWKNFLHLDKTDGLGLEIGCGPNGIYKFVPNIIGIDPIDFSHVSKNFKQGIGEDLPFEDKSVDFVICCNALDHCMDPEKVVNEIFRVSNKMILWVYVHPRIVGRIMKVLDKTHPYRFTKEDVNKLLARYPHTITKKNIYTFFDGHLKYTKSLSAIFKLIVAHILGVRGLCLHIKVIGAS